MHNIIFQYKTNCHDHFDTSYSKIGKFNVVYMYIKGMHREATHQRRQDVTIKDLMQIKLSSDLQVYTMLQTKIISIF